MTQCSELVAYCNNLLESNAFQDYCPNGLQVEGRGEVRRVVSGVTASQALIEAAAAQGADMLLVHHGYFWKGEAAPVTGLKQRRIRALLEHGINLVAYHLPLDVHAKLGNNVYHWGKTAVTLSVLWFGLLLILCIAGMMSSTYSSFLYFQF